MEQENPNSDQLTVEVPYTKIQDASLDEQINRCIRYAMEGIYDRHQGDIISPGMHSEITFEMLNELDRREASKDKPGCDITKAVQCFVARNMLACVVHETSWLPELPPLLRAIDSGSFSVESLVEYIERIQTKCCNGSVDWLEQFDSPVYREELYKLIGELP